MLRNLIFSCTPMPLVQSFGVMLLRGGLGFMMLTSHGFPKLVTFAQKSAEFPDPLGLGNVTSMALAVSAEVLCSVLLIAGVATRLAALPLLITMGVAFLLVHADDPMKVKELALIYGIGFSTVFCTGPGSFSLDALIQRK